MVTDPAIKRALLSVSDKTGIVEFAQALAALNIEILSTGGTAALLSKAGVVVTEVADYTGFPEMLDGRVKTLHPKIHGGLLARRDLAEHLQAIEQHHINPIDLVVVNLYPFVETICKPNCSLEDAIENIDIGGPAMLRSAAKNHASVTVVTDPSDYATVLESIRTQGHTDFKLRFALATKVYAHTARYDGAIANYLSSHSQYTGQELPTQFPEKLQLSFDKVQDLRYGENPHQLAAFYRDTQPTNGALANYRQLQGKALSYNNIADSDAAWEAVKSFVLTACVIVKHANPCGVAIGTNPLEAYQKAFKTDPTSAFGGIIAFNREVDEETAKAVSAQFLEVLIAPSYTPSALAVLAAKTNVRVLTIDLFSGTHAFDYKRVGGGLLVSTPDNIVEIPDTWAIATDRQPTHTEMLDMVFAWTCAKYVKSNTIIFCKDGMTLGIGAGQMSRVDAAKIATIKADNAGLNLDNSVVASDAFFPFRDGLDVVVHAGARCVIQPGGSVRDDEVIAAANEHGITMVLTGVRHFRH